MFLLLESKNEIAAAQQKLEATIRREFKTKVTKNIGYPGGTTSDADVLTNGHYWFWSRDHRAARSPNPRRLNWFGVFWEDADLQISVEINTPYKGRNDRIGGYFCRDSGTGVVYLFHSGGVRGGKKGVGKNAFMAWTDRVPTEAVDSAGESRNGILIMPIDGIAATRSATRYIDEIAGFKKAVRKGIADKAGFKRKQKEYRGFYPEPRGRRKGKRSGQIDYISRHPDIVDAVKTWRKLRSLKNGAQIVKNVFIDLGVVIGRDRKLVEVYEVKPDTDRGQIYHAIGQLMVHGDAEQCQRTIVLPVKEPIAPDLERALKRLGIRQLKFKLDESKATII
jgi:hypothetical protein